MGVAGVAMLWGAFSAVKLLIALYKWIVWKADGKVCTVKVDAVKETEDNYKNKKNTMRYLYSVSLEYEGKPCTAVLEEIVPPNKVSQIALGSHVDVLYDPEYQECAVEKSLTANIWSNLIGVAVCAVVIVLCFVIASSM